jgi:hypothetical protein
MTEFDTYGSLFQQQGTEPFTEEVPLGVFVMTEVNLEDSGQGAVMNIVGVDRSIRVQKALWIDPYQISASANLGTAISLVLSDRWSDVETDFQDTTRTVPGTVLGLQSGGSGKDPWADVLKLAQAGGFELFFDNEGVAVLTSVPDPSNQTPVEVYVEGDEAMLLGVNRRLSTDQTFNGVVVTGEGTNVRPPVRAVAFDEDPASPTYRYGAFGERPTFISSPVVSTASEASLVAVSELAKLKGAEENVDWSQITDPSLDAGDVIQVENTGTRLARVMVLDKVSVPLTVGGAMQATARTVRVLQGSG